MGIAGPARLLSPATMGRYGPGCCLQDATQQRGAVIPGVERCALARRDEATGGKKRPHAHRRRIASSGRDEMNNHLWIMGSRSLHRPGYSVRAPKRTLLEAVLGGKDWQGRGRGGGRGPHRARLPAPTLTATEQGSPPLDLVHTYGWMYPWACPNPFKRLVGPGKNSACAEEAHWHQKLFCRPVRPVCRLCCARAFVIHDFFSFSSTTTLIRNG